MHIKIDYGNEEIRDYPSNPDWIRNGLDYLWPEGHYHIGYSYKPKPALLASN